jgi:phospholipase D1/2
MPGVTTEASGVLVDAADYYLALYEAARRARRSILISGWQFDSGVALVRGADAPAGAEVRLLKFLDGLCRRNRDLYVCVLAWDFHMVFAGEREWMQRVYFHWMTSRRFHFRFDDSPLPGGSHHQKFAVIDGQVAFLGGIDVCEARWDDRRHLAVNSLRLSRGKPQKPYHDLQVYLRGGTAPGAVEELFFDRWRRAGARPPRLTAAEPVDGDYHRPRGALAFGATRVALSRTDPLAEGVTLREVEHLLVDAITAAERLIYIEQYFSSRRIRDAWWRACASRAGRRCRSWSSSTSAPRPRRRRSRWDSGRPTTSRSCRRPSLAPSTRWGAITASATAPPRRTAPRRTSTPSSCSWTIAF